MNIKVTYDKNDVKKMKKEILKLNLTIIFLSVVVALYAFALILEFSVTDLFILIGLLLLVGFVIMLYFRYEKIWQKTFVTNKDYIEYNFGDNYTIKEFSKETVTAQSSMSYDKISRVKETKSFLLIYMGAVFNIIPKRVMTEQELLGLIALLDQKRAK